MTSESDFDWKEEQRKAEQELKPKVTKEEIEFVFSTMYKEAEHDKISIDQVFLGMCSAFTKLPMPHNINSKDPGAGKSYILNKTVSYFPEEHVWKFIGVSTKAILHKSGKMVVRNPATGELEEVEPMIRKLEEEREKITDKKSVRLGEIEDEIKDIQTNTHKLIGLDNKIIIIQDTPQDQALDMLMSMLSQDDPTNQEYLFADKTKSGSMGDSKSNILQGMPVLFTTRVIDDTKGERFGEKNRRFINVTPDVSDKKIKDAMKITMLKYGTIPERYDELVVSRSDQEKAREIVKRIVQNLINHSSVLGPKVSGIIIPYQSAILESIPHREGEVWGMTVNDRLIRYLAVITKINMDNRPRILDQETGAYYPIATFEDLEQTLKLMERGGSNIRQYIVEFYIKVVLPLYKSKTVLYKDESTGRVERRLGIFTSEIVLKSWLKLLDTFFQQILIFLPPGQTIFTT